MIKLLKTTALFICLCSITSLRARLVETPRKPVALKNIGNSCFINAAIQVVYAMHDITSLALEQNSSYRKNSLAEAYCNLIPTCMYSDIPKGGIDPSNLCFLGWHQLNEVPYKQGDSGEFLVELLECLTHKDVSNDISTKFLEKKRDYINLSQLLEINTANLKTMSIQGVGQHYQHITQHENSTHLSLGVQEGHNMLDECLQSFFKTTEEPILCTPNGQSVAKKQRPILEKTSHYVICTLNRTDYINKENQGTSTFIRRENPISFPLYEQCFTHYFGDKSPSSECYELIGVIMHNGTATSGHYTAYVKPGNQWYYCNDEIIQPMTELEVFEIAQQGHGVTKDILPTTLVYEHSATRAKFTK